MSTAAQSWFVLRSGPRDAAFNMALDAALLESATSLGRPLLRFYSWSPPAASFGYFQKYSEVERMTRLRPLVRRPTGGGLVPHDADWTYSCVVPPADPWYAAKAAESYQRMHEWIRMAFSSLGVETALAGGCRKALAGQCFSGHEKFDVLWNGRKIAGAAQRRTRAGLLIQGSVQPPPMSISRTDWERAMGKSAESNFGISWTEFECPPSLRQRAMELADSTFSQSAYHQRR